ncbi:MAG TPA: glutathione S-transferase N-terminal domain-containing protein [Kofleriaceae bacterium]|jgi:GST-like protein
MIDIYTFITPNGYKALIAAEEFGIDYSIRWIDISKGQQLEPAFLAVNPNNKIPAIVDHETNTTVFESGAILVYLAEKLGRFLPKAGPERYEVLEWVFFQVGGTGPMIGQLGHFVKFAKEKIPYAIDRYTTETKRLLAVLDKRLGEAPYLGGTDYSIADMINVTWARAAGNYAIDLATYGNLSRWLHDVEARPAVKKALALKP